MEHSLKIFVAAARLVINSAMLRVDEVDACCVATAMGHNSVSKALYELQSRFLRGGINIQRNMVGFLVEGHIFSGHDMTVDVCVVMVGTLTTK